MPQTETVPLHDTASLTEAALSRRALLTAGAGLAGAAAIASSTAQAQAPAAAPQMPPVQAPVRQEWLAKRTEQILEPDLVNRRSASSSMGCPALSLHVPGIAGRRRARCIAPTVRRS
jgi:hypothetical protein